MKNDLPSRFDGFAKRKKRISKEEIDALVKKYNPEPKMVATYKDENGNKVKVYEPR